MNARLVSILTVSFLLIAPAASAVSQTERDALVALYNSTNGASWTNSSGWLGVPGTECSWHGIICNSSQAVDAINLPDNGLSGTLPSEIGNLTAMRELILPNNSISGEIPAEIGNLGNLVVLSLGANQFSGSIPASIGNLSKLVSLDIGSNQLTGQIPESIGNLTELETFFGNVCQLSGPLPSSLTNLTKLKLFVVSDNQLSGEIPVDIGNLTSLEWLELTINQFSGPIPPSIGNLTSLRSLGLNINALTGTIPESIGNLVNLTFLSVSENQLEGPVPESIGNLVNLEQLGYGANRLTGAPVPASIGNLTKLTHFEIGVNDFDGPLPDSFGGLTKLETFFGNQCGITGSIPPSIGNLTELRILNVAANRMTGDLPAGLSNLSKMEWLALELNGFSGPVPFLGSMTNMQRIYLFANSLTGPFPAEIVAMTNLEQLLVSQNKLTGAIPPGIGNLTKLRELWLNANQMTGPVPDEIGNLTNLEELDLSSNLFTGSIPASIGNLSKLGGLRIATNQLRGNVPREILNVPANLIDLQAQALTADPDVRDFLDARGFFSGSQTVPPTDLTVEAENAFSVTLAWTPILYGYESGGYQVLASTTPGGPYTPLLTTPNKWTPRTIVTGLDPETTYYFTVKAVTYPHGGGGFYQLSTIFSDATPEISATTTAPTFSPAQVLVAAYPGGLVQPPDIGGGSDSFTLTNVGGETAAVTLVSEGDFYTLSPESFDLAPGAIQVVTITGEARPEGYYEAPTTIQVDGSAVDAVSVTLFVAQASGANAIVSSQSNRLDLVGPEGVDPSGTLTYVNSGTDAFTGVLVSDVEFLDPQDGVVTIPPGGTVEVSVSAVRAKRPDAALLSGTQVGKISLVTIPNVGGKRPFNGSTPSLVTVADTVKPATESATIPPLAPGEVALVIPHVGHVVGSVGEFLSDLSILNSGGTSAVSDLKLHYKPFGGGSVSKSATLGKLDTAHTISLADVVKSVFDGSQEVGTMQIRTSAADALSVSANIFNASNPSGNFGTSIPVFRSDRAAGNGEEIFLTGLRKDESGHTNLFVQETRGEATTVRVEFLNADGAIVGSTSVEVEAFGLTRLIDQAAAGTVASRLTNLGGGGVVAYATPVDRLSGDTWAVADWSRLHGFDSTERLVVPVGGAVRGANNTDFRTDLAITNRCAVVVSPLVDPRTKCPKTVASGTLRYYPREGGVFEKQVELRLLETVVFDDVIRSAFGISGDSLGFLEFTPDNGSFAATSRTFNFVQQTGATFGSTVPALGSSSALRPGQSKRIGDLKDSTRATLFNRTPATARTNFGMVETSGEPMTVKVTVYLNDPRSLVSGTAAGSKSYELGPRQFLSVSNLVEAIIGPARETLYNDLEGVQVRFDVISPTGSLMVYTSSVDNGTGDSILRTE